MEVLFVSFFSSSGVRTAFQVSAKLVGGRAKGRENLWLLVAVCPPGERIKALL